MIRLQVARTVLIVIVTFVSLVGSTVPAFAQEGDCPLWQIFPTGTACAFDLQVNACESGHRVNREFYDKDGNAVRWLNAGKGNAITFMNLSTGQEYSTAPNGAVSQTRANPDGSYTIMTTGHNLIILYPTDVPAGPSTTLYVGQVVFTVDGSGVWTLVKTSGTALDICAALSD